MKYKKKQPQLLIPAYQPAWLPASSYTQTCPLAYDKNHTLPHTVTFKHNSSKVNVIL